MMNWWEELLIRENSTPGAIARAAPITGTVGRGTFDTTMISLAEEFSKTLKEIQEDERISNTNIRLKIEAGELDKENIPRIAQALKDKLQNLSKVIMLNELKEGIEKLAKDPRTMSELTPILDEGYRTLKRGNERREFIDMLNLDVDREELMDSLFALMKTGGMDYSTYINDIITITPGVTRKDVMQHAQSKQEEDLPPTKHNREYEMVPFNDFLRVMQGDHTNLEKFKKLVQNVYTAWSLRDNQFKFYIENRVSGGEYGTPTKDNPTAQQTTVASPLFMLYRVLKHRPNRDIFTSSNYGALLGRRIDVGQRANMVRLFARERVKTIGGNFQDIIDNSKKELGEAGSLRGEFNKWMASPDNKFASGDYAEDTRIGDLGSMVNKLFPSSIDSRAIYVLAFPEKAGVNLGDSILADILEFPEISTVSKPIDLLKAYFHVIDSFNKEALDSLTNKLNEITRELLLLKYYDEWEEKEEDIFTEQPDGSLKYLDALSDVDQSKVVAAVDDFNNELKKTIGQTGEKIVRTLYDMIKPNLNRDGVGKYSLSSSVKIKERKPDKGQTEEDIARIKEREDDPNRRIRGRKGHKEKDRGTIQE